MWVRKWFFIFGGLAVLGSIGFWYAQHNTAFFETSVFTENFEKQQVQLDVDGLVVNFPVTNALTVEALVSSAGTSLQAGDFVWPPRESLVISGECILVRTEKSLSIRTKEGILPVKTTLLTVDQALIEQRIVLDTHDIVDPSPETPLTRTLMVRIVRMTVEEQIVTQSVPFAKQVIEDQTLSWRITRVAQKGVPGSRQLTYQMTRRDGREIARKLLETVVTAPPVPEIFIQGTLVKTGKNHTGLGSWYAWTGTLAAASPWLPLGSYVRVTNQANGQSVIVKINDRGPFGKNRIIDLDKTAFAKIASIGTGIIDVKVEEILN